MFDDRCAKLLTAYHDETVYYRSYVPSPSFIVVLCNGSLPPVGKDVSSYPGMYVLPSHVRVPQQIQQQRMTDDAGVGGYVRVQGFCG